MKVEQIKCRGIYAHKEFTGIVTKTGETYFVYIPEINESLVCAYEEKFFEFFKNEKMKWGGQVWESRGVIPGSTGRQEVVLSAGMSDLDGRKITCYLDSRDSQKECEYVVLYVREDKDRERIWEKIHAATHELDVRRGGLTRSKHSGQLFLCMNRRVRELVRSAGEDVTGHFTNRHCSSYDEIYVFWLLAQEEDAEDLVRVKTGDWPSTMTPTYEYPVRILREGKLGALAQGCPENQRGVFEDAPEGWTYIGDIFYGWNSGIDEFYANIPPLPSEAEMITECIIAAKKRTREEFRAWLGEANSAAVGVRSAMS